MTVFLFIALALTIGVLFTVAMVTPRKELIITSGIIIDLPKEKVFAYVTQLRNQEHYNVWIMSDPNIKMDYRGTDGTVGFISAWQSKTRMGNGEQEITKITDGESYESELRFSGHGNKTYARTTIESLPDGKTKVTTTLTSNPVFPMTLMVPMMRKMIKKDIDQNAANLKKELEK